MKKWLTQTSTISGLLSLVIAGLQLKQSGGDWITVAIGVLSAILLLVNDGKFMKGFGASAVVVFLFFGTSGCAEFMKQPTTVQGLDTLKTCAIECGIEAGEDMLSCPIGGGTYSKIITDRVAAKSIASDAGACMLGCVAKKSIGTLTTKCGS